MCVTICGRFRLNEGGVAGYANRMRAKYTAKWGVQIAGMIFQTRSRHLQVISSIRKMKEGTNEKFLFVVQKAYYHRNLYRPDPRYSYRTVSGMQI